MEAEMMDRTALRAPAAAVLIGELLFIVAGIFHPSREDPNDHRAVFAEYAGSSSWIGVHLGQFVGMAVVISALLALFIALSRGRAPSLMAWLGGVWGVVALGLYAVLQAVDGVLLKHAADALMAAPDGEKVARFASAETARWMEWASRSYFSYAFAITLILLGSLMARSAGALRPIGYLVALSGVAYLAQGWVVGAEGFSASNTIPNLLGYVLVLAWSVWLLVVAWRDRTATSQGVR